MAQRFKKKGTDLNAGLAEVEPHGQFLAREDVRILRLFEGAFQLMQLERREGGARAAHLAARLVGVARVRVAVAHRDARRHAVHRRRQGLSHHKTTSTPSKTRRNIKFMQSIDGITSNRPSIAIIKAKAVYHRWRKK